MENTINNIEFDVPDELLNICKVELQSRIANMQDIPLRYYVSNGQLRAEGNNGLDCLVLPFD